MAKRPPGRAAAVPAARKGVHLRLPEELYERFQNAIDALSGPPERLTYVSLGRAAVLREVERLEKKHNGGKPFPQRPADRK